MESVYVPAEISERSSRNLHSTLPRHSNKVIKEQWAALSHDAVFSLEMNLSSRFSAASEIILVSKLFIYMNLVSRSSIMH